MIEEIIHKQSVYRTNYTGDTQIIDKHIDHILEFDKGRIKSNKGGYQSHDITFGFDDLIAYIQNSLTRINYKTNLANFWLNVNQGYDFNAAHIHDLEYISVVYYHRVCCHNTPIIFCDMVPHIRQWTYEITPNEGEILMFESEMPHSVKACNNENHKRISLAFNFRKL